MMITSESHPCTFLLIETALRLNQIDLLSHTASGGPLTAPQLKNLESWLRIKSAKFPIAEEVRKHFDGEKPCIFMPFSDAMEIANGQDPDADAGLLMHMAMEGDL